MSNFSKPSEGVSSVLHTYRFQFHDDRDGGFVITRFHGYECDAAAMMAGWSSLMARAYCSSVWIYRLLSAEHCGPVRYVASYSK